MAGAEARALWQRAANRCIVQEDAKRAPKLACCQSSVGSTKQIDSAHNEAADPPYQSASSFMLQNSITSNPDLPADTLWWRQMQPYHEYFAKVLPPEQLHVLDFNLKMAQCLNPPSKPCTHQHYVGALGEMKTCDFLSREEKPKGLESNSYGEELPELLETEENYVFVGSLGFPSCRKHNVDIYSDDPWRTSDHKSRSWWQTTDQDELASLVSRKSLDFITNCDLPPPQRMYGGAYPSWNSVLTEDEKSPILNSKLACYHSDQSSTDPASAHRPHAGFRGEGYGSDYNYSSSTTKPLEDEFRSKAKLLEALRHSQTRAREAEKAAKEAYAEREHILKLFFRQASQLFAYKQWYQLLQLEVVCHQIKLKSYGPCSPANLKLPWIKNKRKKSYRKTADMRTADFSNYAFAFALGLSLVGAGLLLGWTVGWLLAF